jgi:hypothetical protein
MNEARLPTFVKMRKGVKLNPLEKAVQATIKDLLGEEATLIDIELIEEKGRAYDVQPFLVKWMNCGILSEVRIYLNLVGSKQDQIASAIAYLSKSLKRSRGEVETTLKRLRLR